jgi:hypothetical protein
MTIKQTLRTVLAACLTVIAAGAFALSPKPAGPQTGPIALVGGTAHLGNGEVIENAVITFADGKITGVSQGGATDGHQVMDVSGQHIYPGFILPDSDAGLNEVGSIADTVDSEEIGDVNPNIRSIIAYNTDSEMTPTLRYNGVLVAQTSPNGGLVSGTSSIVQLDAWNWEDAALKMDDGVFVNWPARKQGRFDFSTFTFQFGPNNDFPEQMARVKALFHEAMAYRDDPDRPARNLKLEAMLGLWDGSKQLFVRSDFAEDIVQAVNFARDMGVRKLVVITEDAALEVADFLVANDVPVIVSGVHRTPARSHHDIDAPYRLPAELVAAGVKTGLTYPSLMSSRNLGFIAGTAAAYGLGKEQALKMITLSNAEILGLDDRLGSLEVGKDATLFVSRGDALDMLGNDLSHAFIGGREIQLQGMQQELYERFKEKYANP